MRCRKNVKDLSPAEKSAFVAAVLALKAAPSRIPAAQTAVTAGGGTPNRYDDYVWIHSVVGGGAHRGPAFGPWHRELLRQFELDLRQVSGNPDICIPYWDWTTARAPGHPGWPFTADLLGGLGDATTGQISTGPFANPAQWRINIRNGDPSLTLKRARGAWGLIELPSSDETLPLPTRDEALDSFDSTAYDVAPFHPPPPPADGDPTPAQLAASFRKFLEYTLHDIVHPWVGGLWDFPADPNQPPDGGHLSFPPVAINDPAFWLHHCNVDRLWTIWQQRNPTLPYEPASGANTGHNRTDTMRRFDTPAHFAFPIEEQPAEVLDWHADGVWYASDLPVVTLVSASVGFGDVPEGLTTYRPVRFDVRTCQPVRFRITAMSGANFSDPLAPAGVTVVSPSPTVDVVPADVYVQFHALGPAGTLQAGSVTVEAFIEDVDGYFAPTVGGTYVVGTWTLSLNATPVARPRTAIALVLDRSGSMAATAGALGTRYDLLKSSLDVVGDLMRDDDAIALVSYDDVVATIAPVTQMGALAPPGPGRQEVDDARTGPDLVPRGLTAIGRGMIEAATVLDAERTAGSTPYQHFAMVVMTDGNQNVSPNVESGTVATAIAPYASSVYAVGLGPVNGVSAPTLGAIANYMLITGDMTTNEQRFRLTKYFIQILAGITRTAIVVDPQGELLIGDEHRVPFTVSASDVSVDVIALCPIAHLLDLALEAPDGTRIDAGALSANVTHFVGSEDAFYRVLLPAVPGQPDGTHAGEWHAVLSISRERLADLWAKDDRRRNRLAEDVARVAKLRTLPYSVIVQAYSNLMLDVDVNQDGYRPGTTLDLLAHLSEYGVPVTGTGSVVVEVTDPYGTVTDVPLTETGPGTFTGDVATTAQGVYVCRFRAGGRNSRGEPIMREETRTAAVSRALAQPPADTGGDEGCEGLCKAVACLRGVPGLRRLLAMAGLDEKRLAALCGPAAPRR